MTSGKQSTRYTCTAPSDSASRLTMRLGEGFSTFRLLCRRGHLGDPAASQPRGNGRHHHAPAWNVDAHAGARPRLPSVVSTRRGVPRLHQVMAVNFATASGRGHASSMECEKSAPWISA